MSDNNSDDEALKEIDSEGESTEAVSGQPEAESDVQDQADSSDESHEEASADEEATELAQSEPLDAEGEDKSDETVEEPETQDSETEDELDEVKDWSSDDQLGEIEIEGGFAQSDGTIGLKINGVQVGPLTHIDRTLAKTTEQIQTARKLIYATGGIGAFVLIFSVLFYVLMSVQLSTKTDELNQMLLALGKRGIQLGDGIEELVKIEDEIIEMRGTHSLLINDIAALESANAAQFSNLEGLVVTLKGSVDDSQQELSELRTSTESIKPYLKDDLNQSRAALVTEFSETKRQQAQLSVQVDRLAKQQAELATKVDDLYLIQRAVLEGRLNLQ